MSKLPAAGVLLLTLVVVGCSGHRASTPESGESAANAASKPKRAEYRRVRPAVAFEIIRDSPKVPVIDLRLDEHFCGEDGHIRWSWNLPLETLEGRLEEIAFLKGRTFLVYCDSDECAETGMRVLTAAGFEDAMLIDGGIQAWRRAGFGTVFVPEGKMSPDGLDQGAMGNIE